MEQGYDVYGVDVAEGAVDQIRANLQMRGLDLKALERFQILPADATSLPFDDGFFDIVVSNQVLYYLATKARIRKICGELARVLRPDGIVFFTMYGSYNYYMTHHTKQIHNGETYEVRIEDPAHRLCGLKELVYVVRDEAELKDLFSDFGWLTTGYYDQAMFDMHSTFHWIFVGKKAI